MLKLVGDWLRRLARSRGYEIVPAAELKDRDFARHLEKLFRHLDVDCVLDVGANTGQYRDFLRDRVRYEGPIVSFEPVARNIEALGARAAADPGWQIEPYALGPRAGSRPLNVMADSQFSSFLEPDHTAVNHLGEMNVTDHVEIVQVRTLDEVLPGLQARLGFRRPYLKLDTQGFDLEALRGGEVSLAQMQGLQTEASVLGIYKAMPGYAEVIDHLAGRGFDISGLFPVTHDRGLRLIEFDCVMVNRGASSGGQTPR